MTNVLKNGKTIPKIYLLTFIYSWTMLIGCASQDNMMNTRQSPHTQNKSMKFSDKQFRIYNSSGKQATLDRIIYQIGLAQVVFLGEMHNDPVAHYIQEIILRQTTDRYWNKPYSSRRRQIVLSMEMFERDVQMILDEYLLNIINERHFLSCVRPWQNYTEYYHPLVIFAKNNNVKVIAANAPRRYVHQVAQHGTDALNDLSSIAKTWVAPLPIKPPSEKMINNFLELQQKKMLMHSTHNDIFEKSHLIDAQNLWDATMAHSINEELSNSPNALIIHLNGYFHTMSGTGIPEHLIHYRPDVRMIVINIVRNNSFPKFNPNLKHSGDFVIITDPNIRR
jgi:uncharacterized iron-regulated protein